MPLPLNQRQSLQQLAAKSGSDMQPRCPLCNCPLFAYGTDTGKTRIIRYEECRNSNCQNFKKKGYKTKQSHREIVEEFDRRTNSDEVSSSGKVELKLLRQSA